jgi:hypothetical protein
MFERIVAAPLLTRDSPQSGLVSALRGLTNDFRLLDWFPRYERKQLRQINAELVAKCHGMGPDSLCFLQIQTRGVIAPSTLRQIRGFKFVWCGDLRDQLPVHAKELAPYVDLTTMSNCRDVESLRRMRYKADFLQVGFSTDVFTPDGPTRDGTPEIVAMMNHYTTFPRSAFRAETVAKLRERYGDRFAVYGKGWPHGAMWLTEAEEAAAYRTCKIAIGVENFHQTPGFMSDRSLRAVGSGAFYMPHKFAAFDEHFAEGVEAVSWLDFEDLFQKVDYYLEHDEERQLIASTGCCECHVKHGWDSRMLDLQALVSKYQGKPAPAVAAKTGGCKTGGCK